MKIKPEIKQEIKDDQALRLQICVNKNISNQTLVRWLDTDNEKALNIDILETVKDYFQKESVYDLIDK